MSTTVKFDVTPAESETIGKLMDLIHEHINEYELTADEIKTLNDSDEILYRIYYVHRSL